MVQAYSSPAHLIVDLGVWVPGIYLWGVAYGRGYSNIYVIVLQPAGYELLLIKFLLKMNYETGNELLLIKFLLKINNYYESGC